MKKTCNKCKTEMPLSLFYSDKSTKDKHTRWCKKCMAHSHKQYYIDNPHRRGVATKNWIKNNQEKVCTYRKEYYSKNRIKLLKNLSRWRKDNPLFARALDDVRHKKYRVKRLEYSRMRSQTLNGRYGSIKKSAERMGREFLITKEHLEKHWKNPCFYCGIKMKNVGFDRVDNSIGYTENNIVPSCFPCNRAKGKMSQDNFISMCVRIVERHYDPPFDYE